MKIAACVALLGLWAVLFLRVLADRLDHGETIPELRQVFAVPA